MTSLGAGQKTGFNDHHLLYMWIIFISCCCWGSLLYSAILRSRADSDLLEWIYFRLYSCVAPTFTLEWSKEVLDWLTDWMIMPTTCHEKEWSSVTRLHEREGMVMQSLHAWLCSVTGTVKRLAACHRSTAWRSTMRTATPSRSASASSASSATTTAPTPASPPTRSARTPSPWSSTVSLDSFVVSLFHDRYRSLSRVVSLFHGRYGSLSSCVVNLFHNR